MTDIEMREHIQRWKLQELTKIVDEFDNCICDKTEELHLKMVHDYRTILFFMTGKTVITMKEIICLVQSGYPDGALSLARNLYEQFIIAGFFENHKQDSCFQDYVDDFFTDYEIQRNKLYKSTPIDLVEKQNIDQEMIQIRVSAHHQGKGEYWWAGKNTFRDLSEEMRVQQVNGAYERWVVLNHAMYRRACISLHASCAGNMLRLGDAHDFIGVDNRQRKDGHEISLLLAVGSFLYVVGVVCVEFGIDGADWNVRLNDLLIYYEKILAENKYA